SNPRISQAYTDRGRPLTVLQVRARPMPEMIADDHFWLQDQGLAHRVVRTAPPSPDYVCHDWVFAAGRYSIVDSPVEMILEDNGYTAVSRPQVGDLAVYRHGPGGPIMHTGIVQVVEEGAEVVVESKWGWRSRYLHPADVYSHPEAVCT